VVDAGTGSEGSFYKQDSRFLLLPHVTSTTERLLPIHSCRILLNMNSTTTLDNQIVWTIIRFSVTGTVAEKSAMRAAAEATCVTHARRNRCMPWEQEWGSKGFSSVSVIEFFN